MVEGKVAAAGVVQVGAEHAALVAAFYREVWDRQATEASVLASRELAARHNVAMPGAEVPTFLFVDGDIAAGHVTTIPMQLWDGATEQPAHWLKGLMVLPAYRNGPVGFLTLRHAIGQVGCAMALVVAPEARRLFTALGFKDLGTMSNRIRLLRPGRVLEALDVDALGINGLSPLVRSAMSMVSRSRVLRALGAGALNTAAGVWGLPSRGEGTVRNTRPTAAELSELWLKARRLIGAAPARVPAAMLPRYGDEQRYHWIELRDGGVLTGAAVVKRPSASGDARLSGIRVATLCDMVVAPSNKSGMLRLLRAAESTAYELGADALLCSGTHPSLSTNLQRRAYLPIPGNVHVLLRSADRTLPTALDAWWLMRGDSGADEVF